MTDTPPPVATRIDVQLSSTAIVADPQRHSGYLTLAGTRVKIAQIIGEIADGRSLAWLNRNMGLSRSDIEQALRDLAIALDVKPSPAIDLLAQLKASQAREAEMRAALDKYGDHHNNCPCYAGVNPDGCDCGYSAALHTTTSEGAPGDE